MIKVFKTGDKIKRIKGSDLLNKGMTIGNIYTVKEAASYGIKVEEILDGYWEGDFFELVEEPTPFGKQLFGYKIKVKDEEQSRLIQEAVFEAGGSWYLGGTKTKDYLSGYPHLISKEGHISCISDNIDSRFEKCELPELVLETVKSLRIVETIPVKSQADIDKENLQKVIDKLQEDLDNAKQQLNSIGGN